MQKYLMIVCVTCYSDMQILGKDVTKSTCTVDTTLKHQHFVKVYFTIIFVIYFEQNKFASHDVFLVKIFIF